MEPQCPEAVQPLQVHLNHFCQDGWPFDAKTPFIGHSPFQSSVLSGLIVDVALTGQRS